MELDLSELDREGFGQDPGEDAVRCHKQVLRKLRRIVQNLTAQAEGILGGTVPCVMAKVRNARGEVTSERVSFNALGERESVCDLVVKLTGALAKLIALERQAHSLDERIDPKDLSDEQVIRLLERGAGPRATPSRDQPGD